MSFRSAKRQYFQAFFLISLGCLLIGTSFVIIPVGNFFDSCYYGRYGRERTIRIPFSGTVSSQQPFVYIVIGWFWSEDIGIHDFLTNDTEVTLWFYDDDQDPDYTIDTIYYNVTGNAEPLTFTIRVTGRIIFEVRMNTTSAYFTTWITYTLPPPPVLPCTMIVYYIIAGFFAFIFGLVLIGSGVWQAQKGDRAIKDATSRASGSPTKSNAAPGYQAYRNASLCFAVAFIFLGVSGLLLLGMSASAFTVESTTDWGPLTVTVSEANPTTNISISNLEPGILTLYLCYTNSGFVLLRIYSFNTTDGNPLFLETLVGEQETFEVFVFGDATIDISREDTDARFTGWIYSTSVTVENPFLVFNLPIALPAVIVGSALLILGMSLSWQGTKQLEKWKY